MNEQSAEENSVTEPIEPQVGEPPVQPDTPVPLPIVNPIVAQAPEPAAVPLPFEMSLGFWRWLVESAPGIFDAIDAAGQADAGITNNWREWMIQNGYLPSDFRKQPPVPAGAAEVGTP